ncbi:MAG: exopolyphosphatase [Methanobacteriaceae archaeon]|nr:exopolyphosphatase [Methanobacteriaceae archaeon]
MLYGIIDIGSNTIRFKIYSYKNNKIKSIISKKKTAGLISYKKNNKLNDEGIEILISTLKTFKKYMKQLKVDYTCYFATASLRNVNNSKEIIDQVKEKLNIDIKILDSNQEAELSFEAVKNCELDHREGILTDIGGGSSEIIAFNNKKPVEEVSLPIGSLNSYYEYVSIMLPNKKEAEKIKNATLNEIKKSNIKKSNKEYMYCVGGTIRTIKKVLEHLNLKQDKTNEIPIELLEKLENELNHNNKKYFTKILQVKAERIHTLVPGLIITQTIAEYFNIKKIHISQNTIREGVLHSLINKEKEKIENERI